MPRLLTICGSLGARSANAALLAVVAARAEARGWTSGSFDDLRSIPPFDPALADDLPPAVAVMADELRRADLIAVAAPEYGGGVAGQTKNAFDWQIGAAGAYRKPILVLAAGTTGGVHARADLIRTLLWQGAWVLGHLGVEAPRTKIDERGAIIDPATLASIHEVVDGAVEASGSPERCVEATRAVAAGLGIDAVRVATP